MESEIVFRSRFRTQIAPRAVFVALVGISLCVGILIPFGVQPLQVESWWVVLKFVLNSPLGLLIGLAIAGVAYVGAYLWSDTLVFSQTEVQHRSIPFPLAARRAIKYDQILQLRHSMRGVLVIETVMRDSMLIRIGGYEGSGGALLKELGRRMGNVRFAPGIQKSIWNRTHADYWSIGLSLIAVTFFLIGLGWTYFQDRGRVGIAWKVGVQTTFGEVIEDFTIGPDDAIWTLMRQGYYFTQTESYQVVQHQGEEKRIWELPSQAELFPAEATRYTYPNQVLVDPENRPWLNFRFLDRILFWGGDEWEWIAIPQLGGQGYIEKTISADGAYWGIQNEQMFVVEPMELAVWKVPGFSEEPTPEIQLFETPTGGLSQALFQTGRRLMSRLALASGGLEWVEIVGQAGVEQPDRHVTFLTTSLWGTPYVLSWAATGCTEGGQVAHVGRLTSSESGWEWQDLQLSNHCDEPLGVDGFLVDAQERIWIARLGVVSVYSGLSFSERNTEGLAESVRYTETNSGYFAGELLQDPMGRLWSLDQSGKILVWLDGTVETLPNPLPEPLASLLASDWIPLILQYLGILSIFGILFFVWEVNRYKGGKPPT